MRALVCSRYGDPEGLEVSTLEEPTPGPHQVLVDVEFAGVSFVDTLTIRNLHQNPHPLPFAPGMEVVGRVRSATDRFGAGDRVAALTYDGGHAECVAADVSEVFPLAEDVPGEVVAACLSVYLTAHLALVHEARIRSGESLLVSGAAGGVGLAAVDLGRMLGARVIGLASTAAKRRLVEEYGAEALDPADPELREALRAQVGDGADVAFDVVGGELAQSLFRALGWGGRFLTVGFAGGPIPSFPANLLLVKNRSVHGFALMHYRRHRHRELQAAAATLFEHLGTGGLRPLVSEVGELRDGPRLLREIMDRRVVGKTVLRIEETS